MGYVDDGFVPLTPGELFQEHLEHEEGARYGDPRRCPRHPHVVTSSPNGLIDGLCGECEFEMDAAAEEDAPPVYGLTTWDADDEGDQAYDIEQDERD